MQSAVGKLQSWVHGTSAAGYTGQQDGKQGEELGITVAGDGQQETAEADKDLAEEDEDHGEEDDYEDSNVDETLEYASYAEGNLAKYVWHEDLPWDVEGSGRLIVIGDVHGMVDSVREMLSVLSYRNTTNGGHDTLVFAGDLVAKHPNVSKSLETVDYIRSLNAYAVRGNHDQDVINWLSFMQSSPSFSALKNPDDPATPAPSDTPHILKGKWQNEHYRIARAMSQEAALWLINRSLTLHVRSLHTYIVHAGLLPWTIPKNIGKKKHKVSHKLDTDIQESLEAFGFTNEFGIIPGQTDLLASTRNDSFVPLSESVATSSASSPAPTRLDPELALLMVPINRDPYTLLEMRSVKKNGKVTKDSKKGTAWADIWNAVMGNCQETYLSSVGDVAEGINSDNESTSEVQRHEKKDKTLKKKRQDGGDVEAERKKKNKKKATPCRPLSVIYGHAAGRGLDLNPFSFGLDSGCVYGRSLSALVVEGVHYKHKKIHLDIEVKKKRVEETPITITGHKGKIVSLKCDKPKA